ncbi:hypothetical protein D3C87_1816340 [compost metagenome]
MEHFISQIAEDHAPADQTGDVGVKLREQPPEGQGDHQCVQHDQPRGKQDHPPVACVVVGHVTGGEEAVMVAGMAGIEHPREGFFVMAQMPMHHVHAETEQQQRQRHRQPLQRLHLAHGAQERGDRQQTEQQHENAM